MYEKICARIIAKPEMDTILTAQQLLNYHRDGFLVINDFISDEVCDLLMQHARHLIDEFNPADVKSIFKTKDQQSLENNTYFLESADKIRFFFADNAFDAKGNLKADKQVSINKIGHALHDVDPVFNCFSRSHKIATLVSDLRIANPLLVQSTYTCKKPHIGGEVTCHQDSSFIYVKDQPVIGLWFALEDTTILNGCLWAIPGGHLDRLKSRLIKDEDNNIRTDIYDKTPWQLDEMVPLEVTRGSVVVLHGLLPYMSKENTSTKSSHAYTLHLISGLHYYAEDNWLQRTIHHPFKGFL